jgi:hypothetical protein
MKNPARLGGIFFVSLHPIKQPTMRDEVKHTDNEEKTIPRPEGYTIVKYLEFVVFLFWGLGLLFTEWLCFFLIEYKLLPYILMFCGSLLFWLIGHKITEVRVNLRITEKGLEQTRLSGSKFYPEYRLIEWKDMKRFHPYGRSRGIDFLICVDSDSNFRISLPLIRVFEQQGNNRDEFEAFQKDFSEIAPENDVHRTFFG